MGLPEKRRIGIIGGGQLGKMLIEASRPWNIQNIVLENDENCPASLVADEVLVGALTDPDKIRELSNRCDIITFEIEHIHVDVLLELESEGKLIIPSPRILKIIQDKGAQKDFFKFHGLSTVPYLLVSDQPELVNSMEQFPGDKVVLKTRKGGYDGKGVNIVSKADILSGKYSMNEPLVVEELLKDMVEYSVIVARDLQGNTTTFPLIEMYFHPVSNLVEFLFSPARASAELEIACKTLASAAIECFQGAGLFAVELFADKNGTVFINEIAPRPHNSGHHTIEGCYTSQFAQLNRILLNLPLGSTDIMKPCAMINLVGPEEMEGNYQLTHADSLLEMEGVYIHLYNKKTMKPHRKMGHITVLANDVESLLIKAEEVKQKIGFQLV
ncbi:MAG: 5-(carboxyamino)imidazole ribonucleotide synthase [Bacteroidetes bacterium]|nr:5-(carboxyamino)imidazole ribonucleotide synthase [Bacteroidota bacterium]